MAYCSVDNVCSEFPSFQRNQEGSVSDAQIAMWLEQFGARIDSALAERGIFPKTINRTFEQTVWLQNLNQSAGVGKLGVSLQGQRTLQPGEYSLPASRLKDFETVLTDVSKGRYDRFWGVGTISIDGVTTPGLGGIAGAETDPLDTPAELGENRSFWKNQEF